MSAETEMPFFEPTTVTVQTESGPREVPAIVHPMAPGLAVTMNHFGLFEVTHLPTGLKMSALYERAYNAMVTLLMFAIGADCSVATGKEVADQFDDDPMPFAGDWISGDGKRPVTKREWLTTLRDPVSEALGFEFPWESPDDSPEARVSKMIEFLVFPGRDREGGVEG